MTNFTNDVAEQMSLRILLATSLFHHLTGRDQGYDVAVVHGHAVVNDGQCCWVVTEDDYQDGLDAVCKSAIHDHLSARFYATTDGDEQRHLAYLVLRQNCGEPLYDSTTGEVDAEWAAGLTVLQRDEFAHHLGDAFLETLASQQITIKADDENNAETFWQAFDQAYQHIANQVRDGEATVDAATWEAIQKLEGFSDGPSYARDALVVV